MAGDKNKDIPAESRQEEDPGAASRFLDDVQKDRLALAGADRAAGQEAAEHKNDLKEGVVKNKDGSETEYAKGADGKVHPVRLKYTTGEQTEYTYNKDGSCQSFTNRRADGTVRDRWIFDEKAGAYREERSGVLNPVRLAVRDDGTCIATDRAGNTTETRPDGSLMFRFKDDKGSERKVLVNPDTSALELGRFRDGKERVVAVRFPDGREAHYGYLSNGKVCDVEEYAPPGKEKGGRAYLHYTSKDGLNWQEDLRRGPDLVGTVEVGPTGVHTFRSQQDNSTFVRKPDGSIVHTDAGGRVINKIDPIVPPRR